MVHKTSNTYEVSLFIGSRQGYKGPPFDDLDLDDAIWEFQEKHCDSMPVRVTPTRYLNKKRYREVGWIITAFNYPRTNPGGWAVARFMKDLAEFLLERFKQNRISVQYPDETVLHQSPDAEE